MPAVDSLADGSAAKQWSAEIVKEGNAAKIDACMRALRSWTWTFEVTIEFLEQVVPNGVPALHLFQDRRSGSFAAYANMT